MTDDARTPDITNHTSDATHGGETSTSARRVSVLGVGLGVNALATAALVFHYLYKRSQTLSTEWRRIRADDFVNLIRAQVVYLINHPAPSFISEHKVSITGEWGIVLVVALSGVILFAGEQRYRRRRSRASKFVPFAVVAGLIAAAGIALVVNQLRGIPQFYRMYIVHRHGTAHLQLHRSHFIHTAYATAVIGFDVFIIGALLVLALLAFGLALRAIRGSISSANWLPIHRVLLLWSSVIASTVLIAVVTQVWP